MSDIRIQTTLLLSIANLETKPTVIQVGDPTFRKYLAYTMRSVGSFSY